MNKQFNNEEKPLELRVIPTETNEITLMRELVDDKRPNADGVLPTLAVEAIEGCQPGLRIFQKFDGEPTPPTPAAAQIPLPRMRVFAETRDESYYDEENDVQVIKIANRLKMDLYSPHDIEQFNSFFPRLCFFAVIGKKWQVITKSQTGASYDDGSYTIFPQEIPTLPVTFGKDQIVFESFEDFAKKFNINRFIINYDNKNIQIGSFRGYGRNNRVIRFGIGLVFNPNKTEVKEYTVGQGLHYIRLGEFHAAIHHNRPLPVENGKLYFVSRIN